MLKIFNLSEENEEKLQLFYENLIETNKMFNLTAITEKSEVYEKHFFDSLQLSQFVENNAKVVDIGTGAGFPGIPLAITRPDVNILLLDSLNKRVNFLKNIQKSLKLENIDVLHQRAEEIDANLREKFDVATARAVASLPTLLEYCVPFVKVNGIFIAFKGKDYENELKISVNAQKILGIKHMQTYKYVLPVSKQERFLLIFKKIKTTPNIYPRKQNLAKNKPL